MPGNADPVAGGSANAHPRILADVQEHRFHGNFDTAFSGRYVPDRQRNRIRREPAARRRVPDRTDRGLRPALPGVRTTVFTRSFFCVSPAPVRS